MRHGKKVWDDFLVPCATRHSKRKLAQAIGPDAAPPQLAEDAGGFSANAGAVHPRPSRADRQSAPEAQPITSSKAGGLIENRQRRF
jgi:hypothetical protein